MATQRMAADQTAAEEAISLPAETEKLKERTLDLQQPPAEMKLTEDVPQINREAPSNYVIEKEISKDAFMHDKDVWPNGEIKTDNFSPMKTAELMEHLITESKKVDKQANPPSSAAAGTFSYEGKSYKVILPRVHIPDMGIVTALDILSDRAAQEYLVKNNAVGSVIQEVIE